MQLNEIPSAWKEHEKFAKELVRVLAPLVVVDLGVDYGFSTICLAANPDSRVYGLDWFQGDESTGYRNTKEQVIENLIDSNVHNVILVRTEFSEAAKIWNKKIRILHIDGDHAYESIKRDFNDWFGWVQEDSVCLIHDTLSFPDSVGRFFNEIKFPSFNIAEGAGLGVVCRDITTLNKIQAIYQQTKL